MSEPILSIKNLHMKYGTNEVLKGIDIDISNGEIVILMGASGSGKSTLLRCINHLEKTTEGTMTICGRTIDLHKWKKEDIAFVRNNTSMVFQSYNLFQHKTALENVMEGLTQVKKLSKEEACEIACHYLEKTGMLEFKDHYPSMMSGGQQQRVGIARALAMRPQIIMFDEPTAALDPELVGEILNLMKQVAKEGITMIVVTHQISFARDVADTIAILDKGVISDIGDAERIISNPENPNTRKFLNLLDY